MEYDAFTAGVEFGGLRSRNDIKLLVCYLLSSLNRPLSQELIVEALQSEGLANYFETCGAIAELKQQNNIEACDGGFCVTQEGRRVASVLESGLPVTVREKAYKAAIHLLTRIRIEQENKVEITAMERGYQVDCRVLDGERQLMRVCVEVPDRIQADFVREQFLARPELIYRGVLALLTGKPEAVDAQKIFQRKANDHADETI